MHKDDEATATERWHYPDLADHDAQKARTNALNKPVRWQYEPPETAAEAADEELEPLTAEQLEEIRQAARDEGFAEGKQEGFEAGKQAGYEVGLEEGRQAGHAEGVVAGEADGKVAVEETIALWRKLAEQLQQPLSQLDDQLEQQLVSMVMELTRAICLHEASIASDSIREAVRSGIEALPIAEQKIMINLHPDDLERVRAAFGDETISSQGWVLAKDEHLQPGGCEITTASSTVDVSMRKRMQDVFSRFLGQAMTAEATPGDTDEDRAADV